MKIGDRVTIYRIVKTTPWVYYMNKFVGQSGYVYSIEKSSLGIKLDNDVSMWNVWYFPKSSLKYEVKTDE